MKSKCWLARRLKSCLSRLYQTMFFFILTLLASGASYATEKMETLHNKSDFNFLVKKFNKSDAENASDEWEGFSDESWEEEAGWPIHGYTELTTSHWLSANHPRHAGPIALLEQRLEWNERFSSIQFDSKVNLNQSLLNGDFNYETREFLFKASLTSQSEVTVGRQVLTWGTGDLLFINDRFPKNWQAFFSGARTEALKRPVDAIKLSTFGSVNFDFVYSPNSTSDIWLNGEHFKTYDSTAGELNQPENRQRASRYGSTKRDLSTRLYGNYGGSEWAMYFYKGFYKSPSAINTEGDYFYTRLNSYGLSFRSAFMSGVFSAEFGFENSIESNHDQKNIEGLSFVKASAVKGIIGFETEWQKNLTINTQVYAEKRQDSRGAENDWNYQVTARLTHLSFQQSLTSSAMIFYSPIEDDYHLRLSTNYRFSDSWQWAAGAYLFGGKYIQTFWGQFKDNDNLWMRVTYIF